MSRPRDRASSAGLLLNMEARPWKNGETFTYRVKHNGAWMNLGIDRTEALKKAANLLGEGPGSGALRWIWYQWQDSKRWNKLSEGTRKDYEGAWAQIDKHLGARQAKSITAPEVARYVHVTRAKSPRRADIELTLLSNLFRHGIMLGACEINPTVGVERHGSEPSDVMPSDVAIVAFSRWLESQTPQRKILALALRFAAVEGSRQVEFLPLTWFQVDHTEDGPTLGGRVRINRAKQRGKRRGGVVESVEITPALHEILAAAWALSRESTYVFPNEDNNAYHSTGFKTMWNRCVHAAMAAKVFTPDQRFNFHALRRYYNTMHVAKYGAHAKLHADERTTARVYDATRVIERKAL